MTAHPKYYSYVGLVAPPDKKAVYMGYAFLYGVVGSLIGSNLGGALYESSLKPFMGSPDAPEAVRRFWLMFALLDGIAIAGLMTFHRYFSADTPVANARARRIMMGVYALLSIVGLWFAYKAGFDSESIQYRTLVQAIIMLILGGGGLAVTLRPRSENG